MRRHHTFVMLWFVFALTIPLLAVKAEDDGSDVILDEIVVSATRIPASLDNISASSSIVSERQILSSTASDIGHLLGTTNILVISDYGPGGIATASIRGSSHEQVLVLVDGERINDSRSGGADLDNVSVAYAKRIEVIRGGQSAIYGADAVGGIINIITGQPAGTKARAWSTLGAYDSVSWGLEAFEQIKTVSGMISLSRAETEANFPFEDKFGRELTRHNAHYKKRSIFGKLKWDISSSAVLRLSGDRYYSDKGDPGPIGQYSPDAAKSDKSIGLKADLEQRLTESTAYKLSVYERDATLRYTNPQQPYPVDDTHKTGATGAELQFQHQDETGPFVKGLRGGLIWGISFRNEDIASTALGEQNRKTYSAYVQQELCRDLDGTFLRLNRLMAFPAFRWDLYSDFEAGVSPKLGLLASFGQYQIVNLKANIGRSYRAPTMNELYWPPDAFALGNPDLKPERATNWDIGVHLRLADASEPSMLPRFPMIRCGVSYFWNSFRDRIQWNPGKDGKWSPQNLSEASSAGIEADMQLYASFWNVSDLLSLGANYTFLKAEDIHERQLIYRPRHSLGCSLRVGTENLWGQIQGLYRSRRYYTVENTKWLEPFMKYDLQLGMERRLRSIGNLGLIFEIRNVFDKRYQLVADYPLPGREWNVKTSIAMERE